MPQVQLPLFPVGTTHITSDLAFERREGDVFYFNGQLPVFVHALDDLASFRLFSSQLIANGTATQGQIVAAFGVSLTTVKRAVKSLRLRGPAGFFTPPLKRQGSKLTPECLLNAQRLLDENESVPAVSAALGVLQTTLHKAIGDGRLVVKKKFLPPS